ncbi:uncharacterized protein BT62DRAFT_950049 [Guyanagaster necrorhizus]|uniref:Uncharacterized protein n=1 Tax=Guyanagaster necrorhizus TaxID=856835 RepID=A0A9P8ASL1_9AGAR|nr:uncharacterized protein BT62DRAFT_950049 [Guyanagaster necrorhizus MCA 3950]KAG7446061.1 hypothetical protein BT62DRAFT_950049 [Guyanagaster necrorhizus MCA 3950]
MRCNWLTGANVLNAVYRAAEQRSLSIYAISLSRSLSSRNFFRSATILSNVELQPSLPSTYFPPSLDPSLSSAQLSRAASHAIRISVQRADVSSAYHIFNSVRFSSLMANPSVLKDPEMVEKYEPFRNITIQLPRPISPRLSAHTLLHALIRQGFFRKAYNVCDWMIVNGIPIHVKTLEAVIKGYAASSTPKTWVQEQYIMLQSALRTPAVFNPEPAATKDEFIISTLQILQSARKYKQKRTDRMFRALIGSCILHGEIILASLIFVGLVHDWEVKDALAEELGFSAPNEETEKSRQLLTSYQHLRQVCSMPRSLSLQTIISSINEKLSQKPVDDASKAEFDASLQALANLAVLLDFREYPFPDVAALIRALYRCPYSESKVWVLDKDNRPTQVKAYDYFHGVLRRLLDDLPRQRRPTRKNRSIRRALRNNPPLPCRIVTRQQLPMLDLHSCNSLLHYTLHHRSSPKKADHILNYMTEREKPLWPDLVTYNTLIRSGTRLKRSDITEAAMNMLQNVEHLVSLGLSSDAVSVFLGPTRSHPVAPGFSRVMKARYRAKTESMTLRAPASSTPQVPDIVTLTSHLVHLSKTQNYDGIIQLLSVIFPKLSVIDLCSPWEFRPVLLSKVAKELTLSYVRRGVEYGPVFFAAMIEGLRHGGHTGLAERVWNLARWCERASFIPEMNSTNRPWRLHIHAYTVMVSCYSREANYVGSRPQVNGWGYDNESWEWKNIRLRRFGSRRDVGRRSAFAFYLWFCDESVNRDFMELTQKAIALGMEVDPKRIREPKADARFFYAVLEALVPFPLLPTSGVRRPWLRLLDKELELGLRPRYEAYDSVHKDSLHRVVTDMHTAGHQVAPGVQYFLRQKFDRHQGGFQIVRETFSSFTEPEICTESELQRKLRLSRYVDM